MPVYMHLANLLVLKSSVREKYRGGLDQFRIDYHVGADTTHQEDDELFCLAAQNADDFDIDTLIANGLHFDREKHFSEDFVIRPRYGNYLWKAEWVDDNDIFAWQRESRKDLIYKAQSITSKTMHEISEMLEKGENPFGTIRSF
jgi:hypothetical protein